MLKGQLKGNNGEEEVTNLENLDHLALSKVYFLLKKPKNLSFKFDELVKRLIVLTRRHLTVLARPQPI